MQLQVATDPGPAVVLRESAAVEISSEGEVQGASDAPGRIAPGESANSQSGHRVTVFTAARRLLRPCGDSASCGSGSAFARYIIVARRAAAPRLCTPFAREN